MKVTKKILLDQMANFDDWYQAIWADPNLREDRTPEEVAEARASWEMMTAAQRELLSMLPDDAEFEVPDPEGGAA